MGAIPLLDLPLTSEDIRLPARQFFIQGHVNACFSCALATCLEVQRQSTPALSALFHFFNVSKQWPNAADEGMPIDVGYSRFKEQGICDFALHSFSISLENLDDSLRPSPMAYQNALARRPRQNDQGQNPWRPLGTGIAAELRWKAALSRKQPILLIFHTNESYWRMNNSGRNTVEDTWATSDADSDSESHAAAILGTSEAKAAFIVQDSRGPTFGRGGQWYLKYDLTLGSGISGAYALEYPS
jgi:hypothetical protein